MLDYAPQSFVGEPSPQLLIFDCLLVSEERASDRNVPSCFGSRSPHLFNDGAQSL